MYCVVSMHVYRNTFKPDKNTFSIVKRCEELNAIHNHENGILDNMRACVVCVYMTSSATMIFKSFKNSIKSTLPQREKLSLI